ncbi:hypothetical protein CGMCC3_g16150 [Colletotrichum fructicola]|nr:uncharacterized protein CGMCC3_g16150 [Colletotrichum fructicola]KAE9567706.1 hypothetical protein CGMCC3_g16150 [Colletotrichum fructicola]
MPAFAAGESLFEEEASTSLPPEELDSAAGLVGSVVSIPDVVVDGVFVIIADVTVDGSAVAVILLGSAVSEESR